MLKNSLQQSLTEEFGKKTIDAITIPTHITNNLNPNFPIRPYQSKAFQYYFQYTDGDFGNKPIINHQLLFHMATGSGKTLIMAGLMLDLFKRGYSNFLFFVNSTNIIEKTRNNFVNGSSSKYLFSNGIDLNGTVIPIKSVTNFQGANPSNINISFTTIQGLHSQLTTPQENSLTLEDFKSQKVVLISDEAHHINVDTRRQRGQMEIIESASWETTVDRIFRVNPSNILLEFTATMDFADENIANKYLSKLIFDYPLKEFRKDGYSKEVSVLQVDSNLIDRALYSILLSQFRKKIFLRNGLQVKPVILFKSKTISESEQFEADLIDCIEKLNVQTINSLFLKTTDIGVKNLEKFIKDSNETMDNFVLEIKEDFSRHKLISVNSKSDSEDKQIIVNTLERRDNFYRAIFAVDKLNEGWDVLNLFDIVRLYDTRDAKNNKVGKTTMSEAQLIGRGARYFPFRLDESQAIFQRKYDSDIGNELRLCETLIYHCTYNPKYLQELNSALQEIGLKPKDSITQQLILKEDFKQSSFYEKGLIYLNSRRKRTGSEFPSLSNYLNSRNLKAQVVSGRSRISLAFNDDASDNSLTFKKMDVQFNDFGRHLVRFALNRNIFFKFSNLQSIFPSLRSMREFIDSEEYLGSVTVEVSSNQSNVSDFSSIEQLDLVSDVLNQIESVLDSNQTDYLGTYEFTPTAINQIFRDKEMQFNIDEDSDQEFGVSINSPGKTAYYLNLSSKDWFAYKDFFGTSEEKLLVHFLDKKMRVLEAKYKNIYLLRNEKFFKLFNFVNGQALEPDFVLFLEGLNEENKYYQIFIEPKGQFLVKNDEWKEQFLTDIKSQGKVLQLLANSEYIVWGLPFYTNIDEKVFDQTFRNELDIEKLG
jgi:type III restriction enzyme